MYIIVGIDTGKTSAIACLDLDGNVVHTCSMRSAGIEWLVESISKVGTPVVVATDKRHANETISKLAAIFNAAVHSPEDDILVKEKRKMAKGIEINVHERDALSAAISAYSRYANKIRQAGKIATETGGDVEKVKALVIKRHSIREAINGRKSGRFVR